MATILSVGFCRTYGAEGQSIDHPLASAPPTFNQTIGPLLIQYCADCHHTGQSASFSLLDYASARKHGREIAKVTASRYMPPWLPVAGFGEFEEERRLTDAQIDLIRRWVEAEMPEGSPATLPSPPAMASGWQLGPPDLIVKMPVPYTVPADGKDVYRNFVVPVNLPKNRYVRAVEFQPGNLAVTHHTFLKFDHTRQSRLLDEQDAEPGFPGLMAPTSVEMPQGQFLVWQPGKLAEVMSPGLSWLLQTNVDLVVQAHLKPSGKPELLQSSVGFYFTDTPPVNRPVKFVLTSQAIDIPAGATNYTVTDRFTLPAAVQALAILPHAHFLARQFEAWATKPDGTKQWLIKIDHWDFNWQGDYHYRQPVDLPKGTVVEARIVYDNSTNNPANPSQPPKRVVYGPQSSDEMAEVWLQVIARTESELAALQGAINLKNARVMLGNVEFRLRENPRDSKAMTEKGLLQLTLGQTAQAELTLRLAIAANENEADAHYYLGLIYRMSNRLPESAEEFNTVIRLKPEHYKAHANLGFVHLQRGKLPQAEDELQVALRLNPYDPIAQAGLEEIRKAKPRGSP